MTETTYTSLIKKDIVDDRLCSRYVTHDVYLLIFVVEQNSAGIDAVISDFRLSSLVWVEQSVMCVCLHLANTIHMGRHLEPTV